MSIRIRVGRPINRQEMPYAFDDRPEPPIILRDGEEPPANLDPGYRYIPREEMPAYIETLRQERERIEQEEAEEESRRKQRGVA